LNRFKKGKKFLLCPQCRPSVSSAQSEGGDGYGNTFMERLSNLPAAILNGDVFNIFGQRKGTVYNVAFALIGV
jgi:hypothetical protein